MGPTLGALEIEKRRFVEKQDYEGAKLKKAEMEEMREACYRYKYYFIKKDTLCSAKWQGFKEEDKVKLVYPKGPS
jgi:hypothetical protein